MSGRDGLISTSCAINRGDAVFFACSRLRAAAFYADAGNRLRNAGSWDKEDAQYKQQLAEKQKTLDTAKEELQDSRERARKAGVPSSMIP